MYKLHIFCKYDILYKKIVKEGKKYVRKNIKKS